MVRVTIVWIAFVVVCAGACGSVSEGVDAAGPAADAGPDGGAVPSGTIRWARSLSAVAPLGVTEGSGGLVVTGHLTTTADLGGGVMTAHPRRLA